MNKQNKHISPPIIFSNVDSVSTWEELKNGNTIFKNIDAFMLDLEGDLDYEQSSSNNDRALWEIKLFDYYRYKLLDIQGPVDKKVFSDLQLEREELERLANEKTKISPIDWYLKKLGPDRISKIQEKAKESFFLGYEHQSTDADFKHEQALLKMFLKKPGIYCPEGLEKKINFISQDQKLKKYKECLYERIINLRSMEEVADEQCPSYVIFALEFIAFLFIPDMRKNYPWGEALFTAIPKGLRNHFQELFF
jgi:hypothetical protein